MRVVLDTNVIVSGTISAAGVPGQIIDAWEQGAFQLLVSPALLVEYRRALGYERVRSRHKKDDDQLDVYVSRYAAFGILVEPDTELTVILDDFDDNRVLECAEAGVATHVVTGDPHLLRIEAFRGIPILAPREFLDLLDVE
jgi:putative PIN family toxin of toxin-antitoxin system